MTIEKFEEASEVVKGVTLETKLIYSDFLSNQSGNKVYLKPENMQFTGAYKVRGAYYTMSTLTEDERQKVRQSHNNEQIKKLYEDYLDKPNSHKAHMLLHTTYVPKKKFK